VDGRGRRRRGKSSKFAARQTGTGDASPWNTLWTA